LPAAREKLRDGLKALGLLETLVWNVRSGNLVGGHQRLGLLDGLANGAKDYILTVAQVELTEAEEIEANILLNNPEAQGHYDIAKLDALFRTPGVRIQATGFNMGDLFQLLGDSPFAQHHAPELEKMADALKESRDRIDRGMVAEGSVADQDDFYLVVVFRSDQDREAFTKALGLADNKFQDGNQLRQLLTKPDDAEQDDAEEGQEEKGQG
jgi:hypothetical protein